jgi:DNA-binding LytR/AlgR family response regulator
VPSSFQLPLTMNATALIAEDEPLLAADLQATLARLWPGLRVVATVGDGATAVTQSLALQPDVLFLDIRMPGMSGLDAAEALAEDWPPHDGRFPLIVFVTAYDQYALAAFERAAVDYVLKPVQPDRLAQTCARLEARLAQRAAALDTATGEASTAHAPSDMHPTLDAALDQLRTLLQSSPTGSAGHADAPLRMIQASAGNTIAMVPVDDVLFFEAADKYVRVVTATREHLIRTPLRELQRQLDPQRFWQVHRGTIVRCDAIDCAQRDESGRLTLALRGHPARLSVSRLYAERFKGM